ncbi:MAG: hypothetical protein J0I17_07465 ['Candidatus Kapabacteria' thiocyanatum]|uniref:Sialate O-acetylesterase domain-containing protein n=1 Tax=Candidatus Kapaibacterium thiocyanatum TaxID=1895771 RepID=A0A1M3L2D1_9BACT|nr:hypothetical protein ['Candidatus Kapabacteria' thiocyanatum]OJX59382.1 MAG: hypothetical protein BGO89_02915 ['Candidatus Kapabacteria' thiocyanatum]
MVRSAAILLSMLCALVSVQGQVSSFEPVLWLRADTLVTVSDSGLVSRWDNLGTAGLDARAEGNRRPSYDAAGLNGRAALMFDGTTTFLTAPAVYPVDADYTLYAVIRVVDGSGANNIVSGNTHALWLGGTAYPRLLHGDFYRQAVSEVSLANGVGIVRVRYEAKGSRATIDVNNERGTRDTVPVNTDPTIYIGAFAAADNYCFDGAIGEVVLFDRILSDNEIDAVDTYLHTKYGIPRTPSPEPPIIVFDDAPSMYRCYPASDDGNASCRVGGTVVRDGYDRLTIEWRANDSIVVGRFDTVLSGTAGDTFDRAVRIEAGLDLYSVDVTVSGPAGTRPVLHADSMVCGDVIAIDGQSNSIWGFSPLAPHATARTFGSNFQTTRGDTTWKISNGFTSGGGASVGAWGLYLQNRIARVNSMATCVVNGGVGGTTIEQHLPYEADRYNVNTIYGSWLYRLEKSGMRPHVKHLFWYQGESNSGPGYDTLFARLYAAWKRDLPALRRIWVVQIHTGCGGTEHSLLRDMQRRFARTYPDVSVVAAGGLPGHDGCHYAQAGYLELGEQLYRQYAALRFGAEDTVDIASPVVRNVRWTDGSRRTIRLAFDSRGALTFEPLTDGAGTYRGLEQAFLIDGRTAAVDNVYTEGSNVFVRLKEGVQATSITYVPDTYYTDGTTIYEGPWILNARGMGALTFRNLPIDEPSVSVPARDIMEGRHVRTMIVRRGDALKDDDGPCVIHWYGLGGHIVTTTTADEKGESIVPDVPAGGYLRRTTRPSDRGTMILVIE